MKKKYIILILILIIILPLIIIINPVIKNEKYHKELINSIYKYTDIKNITYLNKDNNYYIVKDKENVIVLDLNYQEKYKISIKELHTKDLELVYRRNNLYYEEKERKGSKLLYNFYNVKTGELDYQILLGGS